MKKPILSIASLVFLLASCGSNDHSASSSYDPFAIDSFEDSAKDISASSKSESASDSIPNESEEEGKTGDVIISEIPSFSPVSLEVISVKDLPGKYRNFYQLLVYSFADGNGDGIGDFKGIIDHLDYLENLGIGGLWLSPIHEADSYHGYDVLDYYSVNHRYEVTVDSVHYNLEKLLDECHKRGIKVILDLVLNHSSSNCSWVSGHPSWYKGPNAFGGSMKDFDYDNPEVRSEMKNVGRYWLNKGVDGFRLDAAKWIYNNGDTSSSANDAKNYSWWKEFYESCQEVKSDVYMIQEVLTNDDDCVNYYNTTMDSDFNFSIIDPIYEAIYKGKASSFVDSIVSFQSKIRKINPNAIESSLLSNHDIGRFQHHNGATITGAKLALAGFLNILAPGDSYIYYGEEIGMDGTCDGTSPTYYADLNYRTPMPFSNGQTNPNNYLYSNVPSRSMRSTTYGNERAENSTFYNLYQKAIQAKNRAIPLYNGVISAGNNAGDSSIASFVSKNSTSSATVILNASSSWKKVAMPMNAKLLGEASLLGVGGVNGKEAYIAPYGVLVFEGEVSFSEAKTIVGEEDSSLEDTIEVDPFGSEVNSEKSGTLTLHCKNVNSWSIMNIYAWVSNNQYTGAWPGSEMSKDGDWFTYTLNHGASNVIFNDGTNQTVNLFRPYAGEYWFVPDVSSGKKISGDWYAVNPSKTV